MPTATATSTPASLRDLIGRFVTKAGIAKSLLAKLDAIEAAAARDNANAKAGAVGAFTNEVQAQTGKATTVEQAGILIALVRAL